MTDSDPRISLGGEADSDLGTAPEGAYADGLRSAPDSSADTFSRIYARWGKVKVAGAVLSGLAILGMMLLIVADVISRNFLGGSISGSFEFVQNYFMPVAVFPGLAYVYGTGILPRMDLLKDKMAGKVGSTVTHIQVGLELLLFATLLYLTMGYAIDGAQRDVGFSAAGEIHDIWPVYFVVPLGMLMILIETVFVLVRNIHVDGPPRLAVVSHEAEGV